MSAERVPSNASVLRLAGSAPRDRDAISAWLDLLQGMLRMPPREAAAIREELESHLRERVRDLAVAGVDEAAAVRGAVSELGDAAALAARYREARSYPRRRLYMNLSMIGLAGAVIVVGAATLSRPETGTPVSVFEAAPASAAENAAMAKRMKFEFREEPLGEAFSQASKALGMPVAVVWKPLEERGMDRERPVTLSEQSVDFAGFLLALSEQIGEVPVWTLDYRIEEGTVRVAPQDYFDRREMTLASYDLSGLYEASAEEAVGLIEQFVHPAGWRNNGGDLAHYNVVGSRVFIEAPRRYHAQIKWLFDEMRRPTGVTVAAAESMPSGQPATGAATAK